MTDLEVNPDELPDWVDPDGSIEKRMAWYSAHEEKSRGRFGGRG